MQPRPDGKPKVKICGITSAEDAHAVAASGADALGINFWPRSKRYIPMESARAWLPDVEVARVGVFVNATLAEISAIVESELIDLAQLHGDETPEFAQALADRGVPFIKALGVKDEDSLSDVETYPTEGILLDAYCPGEYGGVGETFDWGLAREFVIKNPARRVILAGGLNPGNVREAIRAVEPFAVDIASGVELSPGKKDLVKVRQLIKRVRADQ
ncbi:MAG: phosphoribosylanthranilate isomerase [Verrucomicrobiales bacterium]